MTHLSKSASSSPRSRKSNAIYIALMSAWIVLMLLNHSY
ncbi:hypothetical protein FHR91_000539 [Erythrobacter lutimaris]|nr:hypothetical protein [Alteriqipengyuania lutimaris]